MKSRFTLADMFKRGYSVGDIDHMVNIGMATYSSKSGALVLNIQDIEAVDNYFNEMSWRAGAGR